MDQADRPATIEAIDAINKFNLHQSGISYQSQGYSLDEHGTLPCWLVDVHMLISKFVNEAEKAKVDRKKREMKRKAKRK